MYARSSEPSRSGTIADAVGLRPPSQKQAAIKTRKASALRKLVRSCARPPHFTPAHCTRVSAAIVGRATTSTARNLGKSTMAYSPMTMETNAVVPQVDTQSLQPTTSPA